LGGQSARRCGGTAVTIGPDDPGGGMEFVVCASPLDVAEWLPTSLRQLFHNCPWARRVHVVSPQLGPARTVADGLPVQWRRRTTVLTDSAVCPEAAALYPWFRQQFIKLHADRVAAGERIVVLGADTLILDPVERSDLLAADGRPRLRFFRYAHPARHLAFERSRVLNVAAFLGVTPERSFVVGDFVCDLFVMQRSVLLSLRHHLADGGGLLDHLSSLGKRRGADNRFGEWTLYAVFVLDVLRADPPLELAEDTWFKQIHSANDLRRPGWHRAKIVHFAHAPGGPAAALRDLAGLSRLAVES
jgi:hypothetical protein